VTKMHMGDLAVPGLVAAFQNNDGFVRLAVTELLQNLICDAARRGDLSACTSMVQMGVPVLALQRSPLLAAREAGHKHVVEYFEKILKTDGWRCGSGGAYRTAMRDNQTVVKAAWYTFPLGGAAGHIGAKHSLLALTVVGGRVYVLEKAVVPNNQEDQFKNDVLISWWEDVLGFLENQKPLHVTQGSSKSSLTVQTLREVAVGLGPYDAGTCNCHHSALAVFNHCAMAFNKKGISESGMPNVNLSHFAGVLSCVGVNSSRFWGNSGCSDCLASNTARAARLSRRVSCKIRSQRRTVCRCV